MATNGCVRSFSPLAFLTVGLVVALIEGAL